MTNTAMLDTSDSPRTDKALIDATRPYSQENRTLSWWVMLSTMLMLIVTLVAAASAPWWYVRLPLSILGALLIVRNFIVYHDYLHGAILRKSWFARALMYAYGVWVLNPPRVWRQTHNYHHAHTAKLVGSHIGSYATMNLDMWAKASAAERLMYRIVRHPITIALGYLTIFLYGMCISSFLRNPRRHWDSLLAIILHVAQSYFIYSYFGLTAYLYGLLIPMAIGCALGAYLFYAQHNFPDVDIQPRESWSYTKASLESSSFMEMNPMLHWFTGNIGYHHVHHLNPSIPFYRLPEAMAGVPELQNPPKTSWMPSDIIACFRLKLWDPEQRRMVGYP